MHSKNYVCRKIKKLIIFNRDSKKQKIISVTGIMKCLRKNYFVSKKKRTLHFTTIIITWKCRPPSARYHLNPGPPVFVKQSKLAHAGNSQDNEGRTPPAAGSRSIPLLPGRLVSQQAASEREPQMHACTGRKQTRTGRNS